MSISDALGVPKPDPALALEYFDMETSSSMRASDSIRVMSRLEDRGIPTPDHKGRRYYWMDGLGVAACHPERGSFNGHSDQCFFELVDNVHRWSGASRALAVVSATAGGGTLSHNRLQIVVADNGVGIMGSIRQKNRVMADRGWHTTSWIDDRGENTLEIAARAVSDLLESAYGDRDVVETRGGHGLNITAKYVSRWEGTMNVISAFAPGRATHHGRRGRKGHLKHCETTRAGLQGTVVHLTLDAVKHERQNPPRTRRRKLAGV